MAGIEHPLTTALNSHLASQNETMKALLNRMPE